MGCVMLNSACTQRDELDLREWCDDELCVVVLLSAGLTTTMAGGVKAGSAASSSMAPA